MLQRAVNVLGKLLTPDIGTTVAKEMGRPIIDDELWKLIEQLLPPAKPRCKKNPGRLPAPDRAALIGIHSRSRSDRAGATCLPTWDAARV